MNIKADAKTTTASSSVEIITTLDEFMQLKPIWDKHLESVQSYDPFLSHDWFKLWLDHFYENKELLILLLFEENEPVAIAPLQVTSDVLKGVTVRTVSLIGNVYSPIRYFLFRSQNDAQRIALLVRIIDFFRSRFRDWDVINLYPIVEEDGAFAVLKEAVRLSGLNYYEAFAFGNWFIDEIDYSGEEYFNRRPGNIRKNVPVRIRKLEKKGELEFKMVKEEKDVDCFMDIYYDLYAKSWQKSESVGPIFHRDFAKIAAKNGWLRLGFLFLDGIPMACQFWLCANRYAYIMKLFYDQEYTKYAPGKILTVEMMKYVIDFDKTTTVDYLHGDQSYKKDWTPKRRERKQILIYNNNVRANYLYFITSLILPIINENRYLRKIKKIISLRLSRVINN